MIMTFYFYNGKNQHLFKLAKVKYQYKKIIWKQFKFYWSLVLLFFQ